MRERDDRISTATLLALLALSVPMSAFRKVQPAIFVRYRHPLVAFLRRGGGWVAVVIASTADGFRHEDREFTTSEEALALLEELWPMDDAAADDITEDRPDSVHAQALDAFVTLLGRLVPLGKDGDDA